MVLQKNVIARFVSDQKLPITIFEYPYFIYFMSLYNEDFATWDKQKMLEETISKYPSQDAFLEDYYKIRDNIVQTIKETDAFLDFINSQNPDFVNVKGMPAPTFGGLTEVCGVTFTKKSDVYQIPNDGKYFLSIDLRKANFQVLKNYNKDIVLGADTYEDMIAKFTDLEYIKSSKYIREVIFGCLNPARQVQMQKHFMKKIIQYLIESGKKTATDFLVFTNDEVVLAENGLIDPLECEALKQEIKEKLDLDVSVESFKLVAIGGKEYYVKELSTGKKSFKSIPAVYYPQIYKKYYGKEVNDTDLMFYFEHRLAKFFKPLFEDEEPT